MHNKRWFLDTGVNEKNVSSIQVVKDLNPAYAKHMFDGNRVVEAFVLSDNGGVDFFQQPICKQCYRPGTQIHGNKGEDRYIGSPEMKADVLKNIEKIKADGEYRVYFRPSIACNCELHGISHDTKTVEEFFIEDMGISPKELLGLQIEHYAKGAIR